jgi:anti-sigma factor RsiW
MSCKELVELVTDYLEDAMPPEERQRFEQHLTICPGCVTYVQQMRQTVLTTGALREESVPPEAREALLGAFRDWKRG